jgi:hypothetical protein
MSRRLITPKDEPEVRRAKGKRYVQWCNALVHDASWIDGDCTSLRGLDDALNLAERAYRAHNLPYPARLSETRLYDPRRFTWVYDPRGNADDCVKVHDNRTGRLVVWPHF